MATHVVRELRFGAGWEGWRRAAREALASGFHPEEIRWRPEDDEQEALFTDASITPDARAARTTTRIPKAFIDIAPDVACHSDPARWDLLYRVLWRLASGERHLLDVFVDDDVHALHQLAKAVRREGHKLRAFVRFRLVGDGTAHERYVAWFEPRHDVVAREAPFFARRFPAMRWSILTPDISAHWDGEAIEYRAGVLRAEAPSGDALEDLWRTYYANIFNPARVKPRMMRSEMPVRYWKHLPEASLIAPLLRAAPARVLQMIDRARDAASRPSEGALPAARAMAAAPSRGRADAPASERVSDDILAAAERAIRARAIRDSRGVAPGASPVRGARVRVGTASWTDPTMTARGVFYPDDVRGSASARLAFYASHFSFVEVDATYYALPSERNARVWAERTPEGFTFDIKAHALMTGHATPVSRLPADIGDALPGSLTGRTEVRTRELPDEIVDELWRRFLGALAPLEGAGKLGALLLQMPRDFLPSPESERAIERLRERAGAAQLCAVELRHASWMTDRRQCARSLDLLRAHDLAHVMVDAPPGFATSMPPVVAVTSERLAVVRLHGRRRETWERPVAVTSERYRYLYDAAELGEWVPRIIDVAQRTQGVHVVMNNCHANYGASNADEITALLIEADEERRRISRQEPKSLG